MATQDVFETTLRRYRTHATQYKLTGDAAAGTAANSLQKWLNDYMVWLESNVAGQSARIDTFVRDYSRTNPDLISMQKSLQTIKTEGPRLEDVYRTNAEAAETTPRDYTSFYIKGGVIVGVGALVALLSLA